MPLARTAQLIATAAHTGRGVAAFNAVTLEHLEAIAEGAERAGTAAIVQISENAVHFHGGRLAPLAVAATAVAEASSAHLAVHLDHVEDVELLRRADGLGISSVMIDASKLPFADNVAATRAACTWAHERDLYVEAELGEVGGKDGAHAPGARTDPAEAADFVEATGVDALAVAVGSSHAMTTRTMQLDHSLIGELHGAVPVPLVLHGSSGVPDDELRRAVTSGIAKVNIGTMLNLAYTAAVRAELVDDAIIDPRKYLRVARSEMAAAVEHMLTVVS